MFIRDRSSADGLEVERNPLPLPRHEPVDSAAEDHRPGLALKL